MSPSIYLESPPCVSRSMYSEVCMVREVQSQPRSLQNVLIFPAVFRQENTHSAPTLVDMKDDAKNDSLDMDSLKLIGAGIVHDLNNVLSVMLGHLELARQFPDETSPEALLPDMEAAILAARALSVQLRNLFQGGAIVKERVVLSDLLLDAIRLGLFGSAVECHVALAEDLPVLHVDKCQIGRVVTNLVRNAVQAMPNGGRITVTAEPLELSAGVVADVSAGQYIQIVVQDDGIGIPPEQLSMIFAPHFTTKAHGQGLGLALSYIIIRRHNGHISVEATPGGGTTFRVFLPVN